MTLPNFLVIGAHKAGTTALYNYLKQHPQVYMSPAKEPRFFALEGKNLEFLGPKKDPGNRCRFTTLEAYRELFQGVSSEVAIGEASTLYLYSQEAPKRIQHYIPDAKLIAILRNPIKRAYSNFVHAMQDDREVLTDFIQAFQEEEDRIRGGWGPFWHYKQKGFYYVQLKQYFDLFDQNQIKVYLYEDLQSEPSIVLQDIFRFLGVDDRFTPDVSSRYNVSGIPRNMPLDKLLGSRRVQNSFNLLFSEKLSCRILNSVQHLNLKKPPQLSLEVQRQLIEVYREDVLKLQNLIQRDLSKWLE